MVVTSIASFISSWPTIAENGNATAMTASLPPPSTANV
jgi:hypothetical protein